MAKLIEPLCNFGIMNNQKIYENTVFYIHNIKYNAPFFL